MNTVVLVTPATRVDGSEDRFSRGHVRELSDHFDRVVLVSDAGPGTPDRTGPVSLSNGAVSRTDAPLDSVLVAVGDEEPGAAVIIDGDIRTVRRAGSVARKFAVPVLWWCDGPPADEIQRDTVDLVDAVLAPVDETGVGRFLAVGAGIDTHALPAVPLAPRPPLRILLLGRMVHQGGLAVPLRALAEARARGVDAQLLIVDSPHTSSRSERIMAESLVADLMLTRSVELLDADGPLWLPDVLRRVHAVIDAGAGPDLDHIVLEAMACGPPRCSHPVPRSRRPSPTSRSHSCSPPVTPPRWRCASPRSPTPARTSSRIWVPASTAGSSVTILSTGGARGSRQ